MIIKKLLHFLILFILFILFITFSPLSFVWAAPEFQATVDTTQVMQGETLTLTLELSGTTTSDKPDLSPLQTDFNVYGQRYTQSTHIINGQMIRKIGWQYTLEPKGKGKLIIPSLILKTAAGTLHTQPIRLIVIATSTSRQDQIRLEILVSQSNPYLHQPIYYTLRLYHHGELRDLEPMIPSDNTILLEPLMSQMSHRKQIVNGREIIISELIYLLTPLRSGQLEISPAKIKGLKLSTQNNRFGGGFFNFGFDNYRPTTISGAPLTLEVQAPPITQYPWLPLSNLILQHDWETDVSQPVTVGTPLIRTFTLVAENMGAQSPPALQDFVSTQDDFRVRAPKPEIERGLSKQDNRTPVSKITQSFSLIPLKTGQLRLPAIRLPWWDIEDKQLKWVEIPAQTVEVIENANYTAQANTAGAIASQPTTIAVASSNGSYRTIAELSQIQYGLLILALLALIIALGQSWYFRTRYALVPKTASQSPAQKKAQQLKQKNLLKQLAATDDPSELKQLIQHYAQARWQTPANASLQMISRHLTTYYQAVEPLVELLKQLDSALYGQEELEWQSWKARAQYLLSSKFKKKLSVSDTQLASVFGPLNPV
jgi:hypothetical protein